MEIWTSEFRTFKVSDSFPRGGPMKTRNEIIRSNLKKRKVNEGNTWKSFISKRPTRASKGNRR